jgi:D-aminoacyl-tRNA deacylase
MTSTLRHVAQASEPLGRATTFEASHHGPELALPAFFVEIGYGDLPGPPEEEVACLARILPGLSRENASERVALGVGGGHYAPHFTDLALRRRWAFGHLLSRHALEEADAATVREALRATPGAEGILYARAGDQELGVLRGLGPRLRDGDAPVRAPRSA